MLCRLAIAALTWAVMRLPLYFCLIFVLAPFACLPLCGQTASPDTSIHLPTIKTEVGVVLVDVAVTQGKDKPVPDLRREQFQIFEDGKPQTISFFEEHKAVPSTEPDEPASPDLYTNSPAIKSPDSVNVLLLDWLNTQPRDQPFVRTEIAAYLKHMPAGTRLAVFVLGSHLQMIEGFTSDHSELLAFLNSQKPGTDGTSSLLPSATRTGADQQLIDMMIMMQAAPAAVAAVRQEQANSANSKTDERVGITLQALQHLARYLSGISGRKNLIWFSSAFPINIFPDAGSVSAPGQYERELQQTAELLTRSRVSVYPVSATGLGGDSVPDVASMRAGALGQANGASAGNEITMESLAKGTGGKAFFNTNGLSQALGHAIDIGSHYYTLTYSPINATSDGKYRKLEVKVHHRGYKVAYRQGYYTDAPKAKQANEQASAGDSLIPLVKFGTPDVAQIVYKVRVRPSSPQPGRDAPPAGGNTALKPPITRYAMDFTISLDRLKLEASPEGVFRGSIAMMIVAYDLAGKPLNVVAQTFEIALPLDKYVNAREQGLRLLDEIDVPSGDIVLSTGISDRNSHNAGTLSIPLSKESRSAAVEQSPKAAAPSSADAIPPQTRTIGGSASEEMAPQPASSNVESPTATGASESSLGSSCRIEEVLPRVAIHIRELVESMNRFTATEILERERLFRDGTVKNRVRSQSSYVATIQKTGAGFYTVNEYRTQSGRGRTEFGGSVAAIGAPAVALIFHPAHLEEFNMRCEGITDWHGHSTWQLRFQQRTDRPTALTGLEVDHQDFTIFLKGSAWIRTDNYQLVHLETDLLQPIPEAKLDLLHQSIDYGPVKFAGSNITLWLPQVAEIRADVSGKRLVERHTYSDFQLFAVDTEQKIGEAPKSAN
jgi:VWFA-related protein